jgi:amidase
VVGLKPTLGLVSRAGVIPIAHSQDTAGPLTRTIKDAAILLGALVGGDPRDPLTMTGAAQAHSDYTRYCRPDGLQGARLGLARAFMGRDGRVDALVQEAVRALQAGGAMVAEAAWGDSAEFAASEWEVLLYEFKADLNHYLAGLGPKAPVKNLRELITFNEEHRARVMPYFGQELFVQAEAKGDLHTPAYLTALATNRRLAGPEGIDRALAAQQLDALIAPTNGPAWLTDYVNGDCHHLGSSTPAAVAGYPNLTLPIGHIWGLPIGLSFIGSAFTEPTLIRLAYALEQIMAARRPPDFRPTVALLPG